MAKNIDQAGSYLKELLNKCSLEQFSERLLPKQHSPATLLPKDFRATEAAVAARWSAFAVEPQTRDIILDDFSRTQMATYQKNIENYVGTLRIPVGVAGPLRVNGMHAQGDFFLPLATTEAALVASYNRGAKLITESGGCAAIVLSQGVTRAPGFAFERLVEVGQFLVWLLPQFEHLKKIAESTTRYGKLEDMRVTVEGNHVYLIFEYSTGDASGQNMVTLATDAVVTYVIEATPVKPKYHFLEANMSGDKKASAQSFLSVRGKKVSTEVLIPGPLVKKKLFTTAERMVDYWRMSAIGGVLSGTIGVQGHYANGLAALFIACGQDAACTAEASVGVTRFELTNSGDLYASVTLPNLIVGTVGGGTGLPSQRACLDILGLAGEGKAAAFAEVCAATCLAGELSIIGALCAGHFSRAHKLLARSATSRKDV